jgi:hypothetical protein
MEHDPRCCRVDSQKHLGYSGVTLVADSYEECEELDLLPVECVMYVAQPFILVVVISLSLIAKQ